MYRCSFTVILITAFVIAACSPKPVEETLSTTTAIPSATVTNVPTVQAPTSVPATQPPVSGEWLSPLEVIQAGNWSRLQLLKTFPAEMPLDHSAVAISPDGKTVAVSYGDWLRPGEITIYRLATKQADAAGTAAFEIPQNGGAYVALAIQGDQVRIILPRRAQNGCARRPWSLTILAANQSRD